jgi:putative tricarboxylic transport membrane protein
MKVFKMLMIVMFLFLSFAVDRSLLLAASPNFPTKPIVFVVPGSIGGGADVLARLVQEVMERKGMFKEPVVIMNKGGSAGAQDAFIFLESKKGDPHYVTTSSIQLWAQAMMGAAYHPLDLIPVANIAFDHVVMVARPESPYKTFEDVIRAAKNKPNAITIANGPGAGQGDFALAMIEKATGAKFRNVSFSGGGEVHKQTLGGQTDLGIGNPSDFMSSIEAGKLKALVTSAPKRCTAPVLADVLTLKEKGINASYVAFRGWFAPPGIGREFVKIYETALKAVAEDPKFQDQYINRFGLVQGFLGADDFYAFLKTDYQNYVNFLRDMGMFKGDPPAGLGYK